MALVQAHWPEERVFPVKPYSEWALGCDLGQTGDPTALAAVERRVRGSGEWTIDSRKREYEKDHVRFVLRGARRLPLRTSYPLIVDHIKDRLGKPPFDGKAHLVIDQTGARAAGDMFRAAGLRPIAVTLSAAERDRNHDGGEWTVSKTNAINLMIAKFESGELELAADLEDHEAVKNELASLRRSISGVGRVSYAAMEGQHDDLPIAIALALWWLARPRPKRRTLKIRM